MLQYLESLWMQIQSLRKNCCSERFITRPYITFEGSLMDAIQHPIPLIMLPSHTQDTVYPLPSVLFRLFDYSDVPEVGVTLSYVFIKTVTYLMFFDCTRQILWFLVNFKPHVSS